MNQCLKRWSIVMSWAVGAAGMMAQEVKPLAPRDMGQWQVPPGNYSGITPIGNERYAVVSDKEPRDGFFVFRIVQDSLTGQVKEVQGEGFRGEACGGDVGRDAEGVAFTPADSLVWISGEADQRVTACRLDGTKADKELDIPFSLGKEAIYPNYGFEALAYDEGTERFWTMTENVLKADGRPVEPGVEEQVALRLRGFGRDGHPIEEYAYVLDVPQVKTKGWQYAFGAVALCPVGNGRLWVMEREANVPKRRLKSRVYIKVYEIWPHEGTEGRSLAKRPVTAFSTRLCLFRPQWANYEGLCEGRRLADGRRTWLLLSDSQGGYGNRFCHLRDWIRVLVQIKEKQE